MSNLSDEIITRGRGGSATLNLNKGEFSKIEVLLPDLRPVSFYGTQVKPIFDRILLNEKETQILAETRDALLPRLISGELRVGEV